MRMLAVTAVVAAVVAAGAGAARAGTITVVNTTYNVAYGSGSGGGPTNFFNGGTSAVGGAIGSSFDTSQLAVTSTALTNGNYSVDLQYTTLFSGQQSVGNATVYYPDIFLRSSSQGYSNAPFDYAIALGTQGANGGVAAGFYQNPSYLTSQQVWANRQQFVYSGQYTNSTAYQPGQSGFRGYNAATVVTGGSRLGGVSVGTGQRSGSNYILDVQLTLTAAEVALFANGLDVFWGTGDCANGSFLASLANFGTPAVAVAEPGSLALLAVGLLGLMVVRRRLLAG